MAKVRKDKDKIRKIYKTIHKIAMNGRNNIMYYKDLVDEIVNKGDYSYFKQCLLINFGIDVINYRSVNEMKNGTWDSICFQTLTPVQERLKSYYKTKMIYQNGYDIYSDDPNYVSMTYSGPLSSTYSLIGTQSQVSFTSNTDLYINLSNNHIYDVDFKRVNWIDRGNGRVPYELFDHYSINSGTFSYLTQSTYKTTIPTDHGGDYVVTTTSRNPYYKYNYSLGISRDSYLGKIEEIDSFENDPLYYYRSPEVAKILGFKRTYLKVTKRGHTDFLIFNEVNELISEDMNLFNRYVSAIKYILS
jgi:hypothetical protein